MAARSITAARNTITNIITTIPHPAKPQAKICPANQARPKGSRVKAAAATKPIASNADTEAEADAGAEVAADAEAEVAITEAEAADVADAEVTVVVVEAADAVAIVIIAAVVTAAITDLRISPANGTIPRAAPAVNTKDSPAKAAANIGANLNAARPRNNTSA